MIKLTRRQEEVLELIRRNIENTGFPPTRAEIAEELGFRSANAAEEHLKALARKGAIKIVAGTSRGICLPAVETGLPIIGRVAAGNPIFAEENIEDYCEIKAKLFHPSADYLLRVHGMSMKDVGIMDGDLLAVHRTEQANPGDIIVARIDDEVTVKRLKLGKSKYQVQLLPENQDFNIINVDLREQNFAIEGLSVGVIRQGMGH